MTGVDYHASDAVAIAAALRSLGVPAAAATRIATSYPGGRGLTNATARQIAAAGAMRRSDHPPAWAGRVVAAFTLAHAAACGVSDMAAGLRQPADVAARVRRLLGAEPVECFAVLLLDARQRVIDAVVVHRGTLSEVSVHPREVLRPAIQAGAHSVICAHNHPSGDPDPSDADVELTRRLVEAGRLMGIPVLDHLVVTAKRHVSLSAAGLM